MMPRHDDLRTMEFGTPGVLRAELVRLVLAGAKTATAGRLADYDDDEDAVEHVGEVLVVIDEAGSPVARIEITRVDIIPFGDVPWEFADAEGEGFADLADWRAQHRRFWCDSAGLEVTEAEPIVCLRFSLV